MAKRPLVQLGLPGTIFAVFAAVALVDSITPYHFGIFSAIAWWIVLASIIYFLLRLLVGLDNASRM